VEWFPKQGGGRPPFDKSGNMLFCKVEEQIELRLIGLSKSEELFQLLDANRAHIRPWHPWIDILRTVTDVERAITVWQQQHAMIRGFYAGIWSKGRFCGMINHLNVDWSNRWTALSYWLDAAHQGQGIMTACCRAMLSHAFNTWKLNRVTIECATHNTRSRAIPERLGFRFEGVIREVEWLHDRYVDHAVYGMLSSDYEERAPLRVRGGNATKTTGKNQWVANC
jgi:ribosomal-protein-serine acetyltransferase